VQTSYLPEPTTAAGVIERARAASDRRLGPSSVVAEQASVIKGLRAQLDNALQRIAELEREKAAAEASLKSIESRGVSIAEIKTAAARHFNVREIDVSSSRHSSSVLPRQIIAYLARELTLHSLPAIGRHIGGRDHTTVLYSARKIERLEKAGGKVAEAIADIREALTGSRIKS